LRAAISPFQQNPMAGALKGYLFFGYKRIMAQVPYFAVPFGIGYAIVSRCTQEGTSRRGEQLLTACLTRQYSWGVKKNEWYNSKEGHRLTAEHDE